MTKIGSQRKRGTKDVPKSAQKKVKSKKKNPKSSILPTLPDEVWEIEDIEIELPF